MTNIRSSTPPSLIGHPTTPLLVKEDMDALIFFKGYDVILENAIECPCKGKSGSSKTSCQNCLGLGWVFINPIQTKAIVTSINNQTKYKQWSPELTGTISITVRDEDRIAFMDKITFSTRESILSEVRPLKEVAGKKFIFCSYKVKSVNSIFYFVSDSQELVKIDPSLYSIKDGNSMIIEFNGLDLPANFNEVVSIEYKHYVSYNVVDIPHDFRSAFIVDDNGQNKEHNLPIQAIARRSHIVIGESTNFSRNNLLDNSYI